MLSDVVQAYRLRTVDDQTQEPVPAGQLSDPDSVLLRDAVVDEGTQPLVRGVAQHTERGVAGFDHPARDGHDPGQHAVEAELGGHGQDGVEQQLQPRLLVQRSLHARLDLADQVLELGRVQVVTVAPHYWSAAGRGCFTEKIAAWVLLESPSLASIEDT